MGSWRELVFRVVKCLVEVMYLSGLKAIIIVSRYEIEFVET